MLNRYDAGLSIFGTVVDSKVTAWAREARVSLVKEVIPLMDDVNTFMSIDTDSIPGFRIGLVGLCKNKKGNVSDCEFSITFENIADASTLVIEMSTTKGYGDQCGFSDRLDVFNTDKWLRFVSSVLPTYLPTAANTISKKGTATINKTQ